MWPDGSVHWIAGVGGVTLDESGEVTGTVGCSMDITERVEQELDRQRLADVAMLAASSERLQRERLEFLGIINDALNASSTVSEIMRNVTQMAVPRARRLVQHPRASPRRPFDTRHGARPRRSRDGRLRP